MRKKTFLLLFVALIMASCSGGGSPKTEAFITKSGQLDIFEISSEPSNKKTESLVPGRYLIESVGGSTAAAQNGKKVQRPLTANVVVLREHHEKLTREQVDRDAQLFDSLAYPRLEIELNEGDYLYLSGIDFPNIEQNGEIQITKIN